MIKEVAVLVEMKMMMMVMVTFDNCAVDQPRKSANLLFFLLKLSLLSLSSQHCH